MARKSAADHGGTAPAADELKSRWPDQWRDWLESLAEARGETAGGLLRRVLGAEAEAAGFAPPPEPSRAEVLVADVTREMGALWVAFRVMRSDRSKRLPLSESDLARLTEILIRQPTGPAPAPWDDGAPIATRDTTPPPEG